MSLRRDLRDGGMEEDVLILLKLVSLFLVNMSVMHCQILLSLL